MAGRFAFQMPERRHESQPWFRLGQLEVTTTVLVTLMCVVSMFVWAINPRFLRPLVLIPSEVFNLQLWRVVTWPIPTQPTFWTIITLAIFWYFGREIEGLLGRNRFAWFLVLVTVIPGVLATLMNLPQGGLRPIQFAVFLTFIAQYPFARFFFNIPAWALGAVFLALETLQLLGLRDSRGLLFLIVTLATAAVVARSYGLAPTLARFVPALPVPGAESSGNRTPRRRDDKPRRSRNTGRTVVDGPWQTAPPVPNLDAVAMQAELDGLLDKISATGIDSLTTDEKKRLNDLSKRLR
jgi:membrane associated rhomboid family serine protease